MNRVIIAGGGVSGLVLNHVLGKYKSLDVKLLEPGNLGGEFLSGGLKYIHQTDEMEAMFNSMDILYSPYTVQGGIFLKESVCPYPAVFSEMEKDQTARIQADHYRKTRRTEPGDFAKKAMNDPAAVKPRKALKCDFAEMVKKLGARANVIRAALTKVEADTVSLNNGSKLGFDYLVLTIPLWIIRDIVSWDVPIGLAVKLNIAQVKPARDKYAKWDYVYTPYTPADAVHRFSPNGGGYSVEVNGILNQAALKTDLDFIFKDGWAVSAVKEGLKGHLMPLEYEPAWPANVAPLGRFARWDPRMTTDETLAEAMQLAQRWFGEPG